MRTAAPKAERSKIQTRFVCQSCGSAVPRWMGRCPECDEWNSLVEEVEPASSGAAAGTGPRAFLPKSITSAAPRDIAETEGIERARRQTGISELDRVLGGGIVSGSVVLIGGDPGIGKSTLMLQMAAALASADEPFLYVSGEESPSQIRLRAGRLKAIVPGLQVLCETNLNMIETHVGNVSPSAVIIDSIQTIFREDLSSAPGSVSQLRECGAYLVRLAKSLEIPFFIVGHVTKEGALAGPKILEHMVDTVLYFEGDSSQEHRILRAIKNRFGSVNEVGLFEMGETGLEPISNPSRLFLEERPEKTSGSVVTVSMEGTRPLLVEIQALVTPSALSIPRRTSTGIDTNRMLLILAVLEGRAGIRLSNQDVYLNVAGGIRVNEPAVDLAVALAIVSSLKGVVVDPRLVAVGELGLGGEVRRVSHGSLRLAEAERLGFTRAVGPAGPEKAAGYTAVSHLCQALGILKK